MGKVIRRGASARQQALDIILNGGTSEVAALATGFSVDYCRQLGNKAGVYSESKKSKLLKLFDDGKQPIEAAKIVGCSISLAKNTYYQEGYASRKKNSETAAARAYKAEGHTNKEVGEKFGKSETWSAKWCKGVASQEGTRNQYTNGKFDRIANLERVINKYNSTWEYVSGFVNMDSPVVIRCKVCGDITVRSMTTIRSQHCVCHNCERIAREKADAISRIAKSNAQISRDAKLFNKGKQLGINFAVCSVCGSLFIKRSNTQHRCPECQKQAQNKYYSMKKRNRKYLAWTSESAEITIAALYKRDHGICWICGQPVDIEADSNDNNYPSIDHVVPISKGGKDTWDNVRLAHRICNSKRGNRELI